MLCQQILCLVQVHLRMYNNYDDMHFIPNYIHVAPASFPLEMSSADVMLALQTISPALLATDLLHR